MEFGKHIAKGFWGFADKSLFVVYGIGLIVFVIRVISEFEYGSFVIIQAVFNLILALGGSFALQPLIKFESEMNDAKKSLRPYFLFYVGFFLLASLFVLLFADLIAQFISGSNAQYFVELCLLVPGLLLASLPRNFAAAILQTQFRVKTIFVIDAVFFLGSLFLIILANILSMLHTAYDLLLISIIALLASSMVAIILTWNDLSRLKHHLPSDYKKVWNFGKYSLVSSASTSIHAQADIFLLSMMGGTYHVAVYGAAKIFSRVFDVTNQVIQLFLIPASSRLYASGDFHNLKVMMEKSILFSTFFLFPVFLMFFFGAEFIISMFYGVRYSEASILLQLFSFFALIAPPIAVFSSLLVGFGKVREGFIISWGFISVSIVLMIFLIPNFGPAGVILASIGASIVLLILTSLTIRNVIPIDIPSILRRTHDIILYIRKLKG